MASYLIIKDFPSIKNEQTKPATLYKWTKRGNKLEVLTEDECLASLQASL